MGAFIKRNIFIGMFYMKAIIVGGGAAGVACAIRIKQNMPNAEVTVLEQLDDICRKLHATGNGRCNLTNTSAKGYEATKAFFNSLGLVLRESDEGRIYPYSNQASGVVEILKNACKHYNIETICDCRVNAVKQNHDGFGVQSSKGYFSCDALVLATGGMAQPFLGSDGSGYELSKMLGHTVTDLSPALVQLKSPNKNCRALKGVRAKCKVTIEINGEAVGSDCGELLFTDYGLSGIVTMNLSKYVNDRALQNSSERCTAVIDLVPDISEEELIEHYNRYNSYIGILPKKICSILMKQAIGDGILAAKYAKNWKIIISGTKGFDFAQITKGGVPVFELKENNESKIIDNLYIIGELTDNQFKCGGFNLDYAFSSGINAGDNISSKNYD